MSETKFVDYKKLENENGSSAGTMRVPVEVDQVGTDSKGKAVFEPVAEPSILASNTLVISNSVTIPLGGADGDVVISTEIPPQIKRPQTGRYFINGFNDTDVAVTALFYNYEDFGDGGQHEVFVGSFTINAASELNSPKAEFAPPALLYCAGYGADVPAQGRVEVRLQGTTATGGAVGLTIRAA